MAEPLPVAKHAPPINQSPVKKIPRLVWVVGAVALGISACFLFIGGGAGVSYVFNVGPLAQPVIVGKWEHATNGRTWPINLEFRQNGTGTLEIVTLEAKIDVNKSAVKMVDRVQKNEFKWRIEQEEKPVLVIEVNDPENKDKVLDPLGLVLLGLAKYCHFKREGDTLTLTSLQPIVDRGFTMPPLVLRRVK